MPDWDENKAKIAGFALVMILVVLLLVIIIWAIVEYATNDASSVQVIVNVLDAPTNRNGESQVSVRVKVHYNVLTTDVNGIVTPIVLNHLQASADLPADSTWDLVARAISMDSDTALTNLPSTKVGVSTEIVAGSSQYVYSTDGVVPLSV